MADKTINELQLISSVTDGVNLPGDNGVQTYRMTAAQIKAYILAAGNVGLSALDDDIFNGLTQVTPADDDYFPLIDTSDSNKTKKGLVGSFRNAVYRSVTSTDSVGANDETMKLSGASFTSTLPTASGVAGKRYKFVHGGTSISQVYTLATTSSQTIGGIAGGSYILCTNGESVSLESDGSNWIIVGRYIPGNEVDAGAMTITGTTSNPTKATTREIDKVTWYRTGRYANITYRYHSSSVSGAAAGSGNYLLALPSSLVADTTTISGVGGTLDSSNRAASEPKNYVGYGRIADNSNRGYMGTYLYDSTKLICGQDVVFSGNGAWGSAAYPLNSATGALGFMVHAKVAIANWQP